jgi:hypothetical protein
MRRRHLRTSRQAGNESARTASKNMTRFRDCPAAAQEVPMICVLPSVLAAFLVLAACTEPQQQTTSNAPIPGAPSAATRQDLLGAHVVRATGGSDANFRWEFGDAGFTISREDGPIPPEVVEAVARTKGEVTQIDGNWKVDGRSLVLSGLRVSSDDRLVTPAPDVKLAPFCTPVVRIEFGETQYVLGPAR